MYLNKENEKNTHKKKKNIQNVKVMIVVLCPPFMREFKEKKKIKQKNTCIHNITDTKNLCIKCCQMNMNTKKKQEKK